MGTPFARGLLIGSAGGLVVGIGAGLLLAMVATQAGRSFLESMSSSERPADVKDRRAIEREAFRMAYPGNWKVDVEDEDYDPDHLFSIDSPGSCFAMFLVYDAEATDPATMLNAQVDQYSTRLIK